ncbi:MAG: glycoside hydrolase family 9 protein [Polyangiaceae bacterium]|nr:glycoside hydrolase family 9 protein [Polyangiaceae bacterium]
MTTPSRFYLNHIGLEQGATAEALIDITDGKFCAVDVVTSAGWEKVFTLPLQEKEATFRDRVVASVNLSSLPPGRYALEYDGERSLPFVVGSQVLQRETLDAVLSYFYSQRCKSPWNDQDKSMKFFGEREDTVDVSGGWYDASGDVSKYLSHLSYANFMNPQQTPLVVWALLDFQESSSLRPAGTNQRLQDEARYGADFLCRMLDPAGYFYMTVFDQWSKYLDRRVICSYKTQQGELYETYQAGFRQGAGVAIAALARASRQLQDDSYLENADKAFAHLAAHNEEYLDDGQENIIDDYCALLAATELAQAHSTGENLEQFKAYLELARERAASLMDRIQMESTSSCPHPGWLRADDNDRPFYHAAEAGFPALALLRLAEVDQEHSAIYRARAEVMMQFELDVTNQAGNPYGYAKQYIQDAQGNRRTQFFIPHDNETGYWWQGENARLASLAAAAGTLAKTTTSEELRLRLNRYSHHQLDWICGKNPFNSCMIYGFGQNNTSYMKEWPSVLGGICNGITSTFEDESDVDFGRPDVKGDNGWRWYEQWLPHASWFLIALGRTAKKAGPEETTSSPSLMAQSSTPLSKGSS